MKKWLFLSLLPLLAFALPIQDHKLDKNALSELASHFHIPPDADLLLEAQKRWLRRPDQMRWEVAELSPHERLFVLNWATEQGFFSRWTPTWKTYDKAFILGATTSRMQMRLTYLKKLWNEGTRFSEVVWLTGDRPLDPRVDDLTDRSKTESDAAHIIWEEADLPEEMHSLPTRFIASPMKAKGIPNTQDTLVAWLQTSPEPCSALFISNQPYCGYQFAVIKAILPEEFSFDVAGEGANPTQDSNAAALTLDTLTRTLYLETLMTQKDPQ